jgi:hypothetical protein
MKLKANKSVLTKLASKRGAKSKLIVSLRLAYRDLLRDLEAIISRSPPRAKPALAKAKAKRM